jgi:hypothetical protein
MDRSEALLRDIRDARSALPAPHRALLDAIGAQETLIWSWPDGVIDLYATLREPTPARADLDGAAGLWLHELRSAVFNAARLERMVDGLNVPSRRMLLDSVAWHEYGHALSSVRAGPEWRDRGLSLLALLPEPMRKAIDYPGRYRASQVFDEIMANLYSLLIQRVPTYGYSCPDFLHPDVYAAFAEVFSWPPTR